MFNVCCACGDYYPANEIVPYMHDPQTGLAYAVCPTCGYRYLFRHIPLFIVGRANGSGKSAVCEALSQQAQTYIPLEEDILLCPAFSNPDGHYRDFYETWLRMAKNR